MPSETPTRYSHAFVNSESEISSKAIYLALWSSSLSKKNHQEVTINRFVYLATDVAILVNHFWVRTHLPRSSNRDGSHKKAYLPTTSV